MEEGHQILGAGGLLGQCSRNLISNPANMSNFQPLEVVDRGSDTQSQVVENLNKLI